MKKTNFKISKKMKDKIHAIAVREQVKQFLMSDEGFVPIEEAIEEADRKWPEQVRVLLL